MGVTVQQGYTASSSSGGMTLLGTLTTTSGTTQSLTSIAAGYRTLYCEIDGVSCSSSARSLTVALSSTNGAAYGTALSISPATGTAAATVSGSVTLFNVSSTTTDAKHGIAVMTESNGPTTALASGSAPTNTAAVVDAIRFAWSGSGNFDAGSIRVYGVK